MKLLLIPRVLNYAPFKKGADDIELGTSVDLSLSANLKEYDENLVERLKNFLSENFDTNIETPLGLITYASKLLTDYYVTETVSETMYKILRKK